MKYLFWGLWAIVNVPIALFLMIPFVGMMGNRETTIWQLFQGLVLVPFLITGLYTLLLQWVWWYLDLRKDPLWRLPLLTALGVSVVPVLKVCLLMLNRLCKQYPAINPASPFRLPLITGIAVSVLPVVCLYIGKAILFMLK